MLFTGEFRVVDVLDGLHLGGDGPMEARRGRHARGRVHGLAGEFVTATVAVAPSQPGRGCRRTRQA